jgi:Tfp pilus assembly protein PilV
MSIHWKSRRLHNESGQMLVELLISMTFLAVAVGALIAVFASTFLSLRHTSIEGNALTLADKQMETFKTLPYANLKLSAPSISGAGTGYVSAPPSNLTSGQQSSITSGQTTGGTFAATQTVTGPDNRSYRIDTYMFPALPPGGQQVQQVTVAVRSVTGGTVDGIKAQVTSAFDLATTQAPQD